jgi:hypothetical protein
MQLSAQVHGESFTFRSVKEVLARANEVRSGDVQAGLAARSLREMVAAKQVLAGLTLAELRAHPSVPCEEDELSRLFEETLDEPAYAPVRGWSVGELREWILDEETTGGDPLALSPGLTPEMVAAVTKLMSNLDLIVAARKIRVVVRCSATLGLPGRISSRLQPNHPRDELAGILAAIREGLSYGNGDAVIGVNPSTESVGAVAEILRGVFFSALDDRSGSGAATIMPRSASDRLRNAPRFELRTGAHARPHTAADPGPVRALVTALQGFAPQDPGEAPRHRGAFGTRGRRALVHGSIPAHGCEGLARPRPRRVVHRGSIAHHAPSGPLYFLERCRPGHGRRPGAPRGCTSPQALRAHQRAAVGVALTDGTGSRARGACWRGSSRSR